MISIEAVSLICLCLIFLGTIFYLWRTLKILKRQLDEKCQEINLLKKQRNELVVNVSHDLRTPLTSIKGYAETLRNGALHDPEKAEKFLQRIEESANHLTHLICDTLDLAKLEATNAHLCIQEFSLEDFLEELNQKFSFLIARINQKLIIQNSIKTLRADKNLVHQALSNLIENAHRYCPEGVEIKIQSSHAQIQDNRWIQIEVSDNGPGIPQEDIDRVFERFYRGEKSRDRSLGGTGLGLAIVKHIMIAHGGHIRVKSELHKGTTFTLLFPAE